MKINKETLQAIAHLARLELPQDPEVQAKLVHDLQQITAWMEALQAVDTQGVEPLSHILDEIGEGRVDAMPKEQNTQELINLAPKPEGAYFSVPKVLESPQSSRDQK